MLKSGLILRAGKRYCNALCLPAKLLLLGVQRKYLPAKPFKIMALLEEERKKADTGATYSMQSPGKNAQTLPSKATVYMPSACSESMGYLESGQAAYLCQALEARLADIVAPIQALG